MNEPIEAESFGPVGEVVAASTTEYLTQCRELYGAPVLGTLVKSEGADAIYAIVGEVATQSIDPGRRAMAMGRHDETSEAVYERNPQLTRLLATEFRSVVVGYRVDGTLHRYLAPLPPKIHSSVFPCVPEEVVEFSGSLDFVPLLLAAPFGSQDDVVSSFLRLASTAHPDPERFLVDAGRDLAKLLTGQLQRLNGVLTRLTS